MSAYRSSEPCPRCKSGTTTSEGECLACGAVWGSAFLCPHCGEHAKIVEARVVGSACAKCKVARVEHPLPKEAYAPLFALLRSYRLLPVRAAIFVPALAIFFAVVATDAIPSMKANARNERESFIAERGTTVGAPSSMLEHLPDSSTAFLAALGGVGALGIGVFLSIAGAVRLRIRREARRLSALGPASPSGGGMIFPARSARD